VKQFEQPALSQADELLHLPDKPAGVDDKEQRLLAPELLHLPNEPAGVWRTKVIEKSATSKSASKGLASKGPLLALRGCNARSARLLSERA
jgi:hypothetical protein